MCALVWRDARAWDLTGHSVLAYAVSDGAHVSNPDVLQYPLVRTVPVVSVSAMDWWQGLLDVLAGGVVSFGKAYLTWKWGQTEREIER